MRPTRLFLLAALFAATLPLQAREYVAIEKRLSADQMKATGLDQLTGQQLDLLNRLLSDDQQAVVKAAREDSATKVRGASFSDEGVKSISSALVGELRGWTRGTELTLANGQRWRVTEGDYTSMKRISNANVTITPGLVGGWYLQVEGHVPRPKVTRID
ncbi:hypothetical protein IB223_12030 [Pseudoxanthomonas sp. PXM03]|jgi:hypothetical protein|uniref:hypothetical protein n=1 Tax=Pseudoxanthomonas sp. PXM03 TaxID=2769284 RepID=UPI00177F3F3B|nr:hypothetical protein [Pseudoxanthomonas sp. PXM03]MBD9436822.1 hypothetical protein [Pseudoxanthomonas sp. PXM03]